MPLTLPSLSHSVCAILCLPCWGEAWPCCLCLFAQSLLLPPLPTSLPRCTSVHMCVCKCVSVCPFISVSLISSPGSFLLCSTSDLISCFSFSRQFPGKIFELWGNIRQAQNEDHSGKQILYSKCQCNTTEAEELVQIQADKGHNVWSWLGRRECHKGQWTNLKNGQ